MEAVVERAGTNATRRALVAVATLATIVLCVAAGEWQRGRMHEKEALGRALAEASALPPVALPAPADWSAWRYRAVVLEGAWLPGPAQLVDNAILQGRAGFRVLAPLRLDDGRAVLVDRGWIAAGAGASRVPAVATPAGAARVEGRVLLPPKRTLELAPDDARGPLWQNADPARIGAALGVDLLPVIVAADPASAPRDGLERSRPAPDTGVDKHRSYMGQWYLFAILAAALWIGFTTRDLLRTHGTGP
jgi:surfeit locus 1 family protein